MAILQGRDVVVLMACVFADGVVLQVIMGSNMDATAGAAATAAAGSSGRPAEEWSTVLSSMLGECKYRRPSACFF